MASRIPHLLEPYLALPAEASLILLTNILGASSNWLILRFLYSALQAQSSNGAEGGEIEVKILLVSFLRDLAFWKEGARRLGLDLDRLSAKKKFWFVDGLSNLFVPKQQRDAPLRVWERVLSSPELESVSGEVQKAILMLKEGSAGCKVILVVDQLDLLLAAGGAGVGAMGVGEMLMGWREEIHATVVSLSADLPLVAAQQTLLEVNHAAFLISVAHDADFTMGLRLLDTGTARDVSGVVRITVGDGSAEDEKDGHRKIEERELLYFVGGDGGVKVFERGQ